MIEVENCTAPGCPLFEFRRGKDPMPSRSGPKNPFFNRKGMKKNDLNETSSSAR